MKGTYTALVTPFSEAGIDIKRLVRLIDFQYKNGADGVVLLGTTGEAPTISEREADEIIYEGLKAAEGKIDVVIGCSSNSTAEAVKKCRRAASLGAEKLLVLTPYYNKTNKEGMKRHFLTVAEGVQAKTIIYNVPSRTGCSVDTETLEELSNHENIIGIKEASGNISYAARVASLISDDFFMISGCDDITVPLMSMGASGVISVASNIVPGKVCDMTRAFLSGDTSTAKNIQISLLPLISALFSEVNPIPVKTAMNIMKMNVGGFRLPLFEMSADKRKILENVMRAEGLV
ncbi:MAG: 4-hydroxy-tetrahydrodipicolinate synthase [Eubacteriales bacterium]|nr:4-hydroxy-tetrahydrodipicolinate synthase [Eubacteriales bacterium]